MDIKEFIENFAAQFDETDASVFTPQTKYHDEYDDLHRPQKAGPRLASRD